MFTNNFNKPNLSRFAPAEHNATPSSKATNNFLKTPSSNNATPFGTPLSQNTNTGFGVRTATPHPKKKTSSSSNSFYGSTTASSSINPPKPKTTQGKQGANHTRRILTAKRPKAKAKDNGGVMPMEWSPR